MRNSYQITVEKEQLIFSAAHFITFNRNICERIHGHNYRVQCKLTGPLDENGYVVDFIALRDALMTIVSRLDHHVLLPTEHDSITVEIVDDEVVARFDDRRWVFPRNDCVFLPISNTTAELMAMFIGDELIRNFLSPGGFTWENMTLGVDENEGQWAYCRFENSP